MDSLVKLTKVDEIAVITIDNPPVNALSPGVPEGISEAVAQVQNDSSVVAAVLIGHGGSFIAGADINEFGKVTSGGRDSGSGFIPLLMQIEDCRKPIVAAIAGNALGGGLETAMACHYRVAVVGAKLGLPEVNLGLIPGIAGTQRLPRLVGVPKAIEMCTEGKPISAQEGLECGILDRVIEGDLLFGALAWAREVAGKPVPKTRERSSTLGTPAENAALFAAARDAGKKKFRGLLAPFAVIDAIEAATKLPFIEGQREEKRLFAECLFSTQSKSLIHVFFAEREVSKIPDIPKHVAVLPIAKVGIVGAGTMGGGIAMAFLNAGYQVLLKDVDQAALDRGQEIIRKNYASSVKRGRFTQQYVDERMALLKPTLDWTDFAEVDLVVEGVFENLEIKKSIFAELNRVCKPTAILASNTSTLSIDALAASTSRPGYVVGLHFFVPANVMRLLEIVRGEATSREVLATAMMLAKKLRKVGVLVGNCPGFVGNRMLDPYLREAQFLAEEGAPAEVVDRALTQFGMALGPLAMGDMSGLQMGYHVRKEKEKAGAYRPDERRSFVENRLFEMGRQGQKNGLGWYKYDADRRAQPDSEVTALVRQWSLDAGIAQREISSEEIVERCIYALINEGARILEEGYALRAGDIDIVYLNGYGFPAYRGGPMFYADTVGLKKVYERICQFHDQHGMLWEPAPLLKWLAQEGGTFANFDRRAGAAQ